MDVVVRDPRDLLDAKAAYIRYLGSDYYARLEQEQHDLFGEEGDLGASYVAEDLIESLQKAQNFWVAEDMVTVLEAAQGSMPDDGVMLGELPSPHGFLILSRPVRLPDPENFGAMLDFSALHWRPSHLVLPASNFAPVFEDDGIVLQWFSRARDTKVIAIVGDYWPYPGKTFLTADQVLQHTADIASGGLDRTSMDLSRHARAMWTLMQQQLIATTTVVDGHRKQQEKARRARTSSSVSIVTLRRKTVDRPGGGGVHVEYSHRWVVRGHWRNQWHPGLHAHRPHWIADHIKGPVDAPLVVKEKINLWKR